MNSTIATVLEMLEDDMVSHGLLAQCLNKRKAITDQHAHRLARTLRLLLATEEVEIGVASRSAPGYVEFVAWKGSIEERIGRALMAVSITPKPNKEFAYWLCYRKNVDRFE